MKMNKHFKEFIGIACIPVLVLILSLFLKSATGPYWLGANSDPAYLYLINSLYILKGISPSFVDHPGTTLEILGAVVIKCMNWSAPQPDLIDNVLLDPEYYLNALYYVILFLDVGSLVFLGAFAYRKTRNWIFPFFVQSGAFMFLILRSYVAPAQDFILPVAANVFAESLFPMIDNLFIFCVLYVFFEKKKSYGMSFFWGLVSAAGVITKMSFAPLVIIPVILIKGFRARIFFLMSFFLGCFLFTIPIIPEYKEMFNYIYLFQANKGFHGTGGVGMMSLSELWKKVCVFFPQQKFLMGSCLGSMMVLAAGIGRSLRDKTETFKQWVQGPELFLSVLILGMALQILFVLKHPAPHYAAPTAGFVGVLLGFSFLVLQEKFPVSSRIYGGLLCVMCVGFTVYVWNYQNSLRQENAEMVQFSKKVYDQYQNCLVCNHYRSSSVAYALYFGDDCKGRHRAFFDRLKELYPKALVWNRWDYTFHHFSDQISDESLLAATPCLLLYGTQMNFSTSYINAEQVDSSRKEFVYKVVSSNRKAALEVFLLAKALEIKKDYKTAIVVAMKAKELGFPPLRIDHYIGELKAKITTAQANSN